MIIIFMGISTLLIYSSTHQNPSYNNFYIKNLINYFIGFIFLFTLFFISNSFLKKYSYWLYIGGISSLILVSIFGDEVNGAKSWFNIPIINFSFQPAELMKIFLIMALAKQIETSLANSVNLTTTNVFYILCIFFPPTILVILQPDLGNAVVYMVILLVVLWVGNLKYKVFSFILSIIIIFVTLFPFVFNKYNDEIKTTLSDYHLSHWYSRINTFINPNDASDDAKYQVKMSTIAIGSGALFGDGFLKGDTTQTGRVPYTYSDSIFAVLGEEFGFVGSSLLLLLYLYLIYRIILIGQECSKDIYNAVIIVGICGMFLFQIFENIGMLIGLMPLTGITLPFVSYGGSSLIINMICIGLILQINKTVREN